MRRHHADRATLITSAPESSTDEFDRRKKRYAIMMATRALCVIGAAATYHLSTALAVAFAVAGVILPWCAVIIANDGPPKKRRAAVVVPVATNERALPPPAKRTVDG